MYCEYIIYSDSEDEIFRNCSIKPKCKVNGQVLCKKHAKIKFNPTCVLIQAAYKSYRTRRKINNIFVNLPRDLQCLVIYYISEPLYLMKIYNKINKIICTKFDYFIENIDTVSLMYNVDNDIFNCFLDSNVNNFINFIQLMNKYKQIIDKKKYKKIIYICDLIEINIILQKRETTEPWTLFIENYKKLKLMP